MGIKEISAKYRNTDNERLIAVISLVLVILLIGSAVVFCVHNPGVSSSMLSMLAIRLCVNRVASLFFGYTAGIEKIWVIYMNLLIELIWVFAGYFLFLLTWHRLLNIEWMKKRMDDFVLVSQKYRRVIENHGKWGLFLFVAIPLPMTGPFMGSIIGFFMGLTHWINLTIVQSAAVVTMVTWAVMLLYVNHWATDLGKYVPFYIFLFILLVFIINKLVKHFSKSSHDKRLC